jgi:threonine dehydrogenase-like Zn-dependent dehydrogenase
MMMRAVVVEGKQRAVVRTVEAPQPGARALVRVQRGGLCGTDLKILSGEIPVAFPRVLGHEMVGRVEVPGARGLVPAGTRVLIDPGISCGYCAVCRDDRPYLCPSGALMGRDVDGGFADLVAVDETCLHPVPQSISDDASAVLQVLATCVHGQERVQISPPRTAVVVGLGVSGLLHLQLMRARGMDTVVGVTRSGWKRELAKSLGATAVAEPQQAQQVVADVSGGQGAGLVVECVGSAPALRQAMTLAGPGGTVLVFGIPPAQVDGVPGYRWYFQELTIVNTRAARPRDYDRAVRLAAAGVVALAPLVTATYPLADVAEAIEVTRDPAHLKVVLKIA